MAADLPPALDDFFARALSRDRAARFQSAQELSRAFAVAAGLVDHFSMPPGPATYTGFGGTPASPLTDIVLCGHSYGGMVITGAIAQITDRIRSAVYLDAYLPEDGQCTLVP